jgi:hypothetical protein
MMPKYYRFQNDQPRMGEPVHCFKTLKALKDFASMMRTQDPNFHRMKFWEIEGIFIKSDDGDAVVRVTAARQIRL